MYISQLLVERSLRNLEKVHPFFGITFLACKLNELPVGKEEEFLINKVEEEFLKKFYKPEDTKFYFRPFKVSDKSQQWLRADYPSSGSQKTRTNKFKDAFIHTKNTSFWGWQSDYVEKLRKEITESIPLLYLAVWIYRDREFSNEVSLPHIMKIFCEEFHINQTELDALFNKKSPHLLDTKLLFDYKPFDWLAIKRNFEISDPPDAKPGIRYSLKKLLLEGIGPSKVFDIDFADRINIFTGDNGLGKTFILETAWRSLSGEWAGEIIHPNEENFEGTPFISYSIKSSSKADEVNSATYSWKLQDWISSGTEKNEPSILLYAKSDGSFSVLDPLRNSDKGYRSLNLSVASIWDGLPISEGNRLRFVCNGIIADWNNWQSSKDQSSFQVFVKILNILSPPDLEKGDLGILKPGKLTRIPGESRPIPTIDHPYGNVAITNASAAVKRILSLAYIIVWTWLEHKSNAKLSKSIISSHIIILIDEIESHLHPKWQRLILPAILNAIKVLERELNVQLLITSHSPLILSSLEPIFKEDIDNIFNLSLIKNHKNSEVIISNPNFVKYGSVNSWLMSDFFNLSQARSLESELVIKEAKEVLLSSSSDLVKINSLNNKLMNLLPAHDEFWIRWNYFVNSKQ